MTIETHHQATLVETAKMELTRAHRAALALDASEIRRGIQLAVEALRAAAGLTPGETEPAVPPTDALLRLAGELDHALTDLGDGKLAEMGNILEAARKDLEA
jgi:hypothetical protein